MPGDHIMMHVLYTRSFHDGVIAMVRPATLTNTKLPGAREDVARLMESRIFVRFITGLILINAVTLGIQADAALMSAYDAHLFWFDRIVISIFAVELVLKLYAYRLAFFRSGWNIFDFLIVGISLIPKEAGLAILRAFRIFRIFRLISIIPQMRSVIGALFHAIPGMASIIGVLFVIIYVAAVLAMQLFGQSTDADIQAYFGSIGHSLYTMFQLLTLEDWTDVANATMAEYPWAWLFFITYMVITSFAVLNLFIGIIVDSLHIVKEQDMQEEDDKLMREIKQINGKLDSVQRDIEALKNRNDEEDGHA
jgi:voltage-gated sodium channel